MRLKRAFPDDGEIYFGTRVARATLYSIFFGALALGALRLGGAVTRMCRRVMLKHAERFRMPVCVG